MSLSTILGRLATYLKPDSNGFVNLVNQPAQFDITTKIADTAWVKALGINFASWAQLGATATLTAAQAAGQAIQLSGANMILTLPLAASVPSGTAIYFFSTATGNGVARQGSDNVYVSGSNVTTTIPLQSGDSMMVVSSGSNWYVCGGSVQWKYAPGQAALLSGIGYQKFPSGLILQWGTFVASASADTPITWPLAFPNAAFMIVATPNNSGSSFVTQYTSTVSGCLFNNWTTTGTRLNGAVQYYVLGY
jgi:hypothetical protein